MKKILFLLTLVLFSISVFSDNNKDICFITGADISWVQQQEDKGITFSEKGIKKDVLQILKDNNFNWIRLRLFVNPKADSGYSKEGYCDLDHTLKMAKRIKDAGMKFLLDFHYSDNWADPGKQYAPASWSGLDVKGLEKKIYEYTKSVLDTFKTEGITPDMVQIGNEINHGIVWPLGKNDVTFEYFGRLLRSASLAVRKSDPGIKIMIHIACGGQNQESVLFFDNVLNSDVDFDVIGQSYYPKWHGTLYDLMNNLTDLILRYEKPVVVVEYQDYRKEVNDIVKDLPAGKGIGTFIWEATSPQWGGLFDAQGRTTDNMLIYKNMFNVIKTSK